MLTLRSGKIFKGLRTAMSALLLLLSFIYRYTQGAVYATFSVRGKQSEHNLLVHIIVIDDNMYRTK